MYDHFIFEIDSCIVSKNNYAPSTRQVLELLLITICRAVLHYTTDEAYLSLFIDSLVKNSMKNIDTFDFASRVFVLSNVMAKVGNVCDITLLEQYLSLMMGERRLRYLQPKVEVDKISLPVDVQRQNDQPTNRAGITSLVIGKGEYKHQYYCGRTLQGRLYLFICVLSNKLRFLLYLNVKSM